MQGMNLLEFVMENRLERDPKIMALLCAAIRNPRSSYNDSLLRLLKPKMLENAIYSDPFKPYPCQADFKGNVFLGLTGIRESYSMEDIQKKLKPGVLVLCNSDLFTRHVLVAGATGFGKSILFFFLQDALLDLGINYISIGFKRDGRHRIRHDRKLLVFIISSNPNFYWNFTVAPPGVQQNDWDITWTRVFCETQSLSMGIEAKLHEVVRALRDGNQVITMESIYKEIEKTSPKAFRDINWKASLLNRIGSMRIFNKMLNTKKPFPLEKMIEHYSIEFELDNAGEFKSTFGTLIPIYLYKHRIANNLRT